MLSAVTGVFQKDRFAAAVLFGLAVFLGFSPRFHAIPALPFGEPIRPLGVHSSSVRSGLEQRLLLLGGDEKLVVAEKPVDLGHLEPKGRTNPDGSEVWGYPEGSGLEEVIEVHVKDGRVVREVLRPSSRIAADAFRDS